MKTVYKHEFNRWQRFLEKTLGMWRINQDSIDFKWGYFAPRWGFELVIGRGSYFDRRYCLSFCLGWGHFSIKFPCKTSLQEGCDPPRYGIAAHHGTLWVYKGGEYDNSIGQVTRNAWWTWDLPFITLSHVDSYMDTAHGWVKDNVVSDHVKAQYYTLPVKYVTKRGQLQRATATFHKTKSVFSRKWLPFYRKTIWGVRVDFDTEIGEGVGSFKGGTLSIRTTLPSDMPPVEALDYVMTSVKL